MEIRVLGPIEVRDAGQPVTIRRPRERALLALLAAEPGRVISTDRLVDGLWGASPPTTATKTLHTYVHHLRSRLPDGTIVTDAAGYRLQIESRQVDAHRFVADITAARDRLADDPRDAVERLTTALSAWRGEPFADAGDAEGIRPLRTRLEDLRVQASVDALAARIHLGHHDRVLPELRALIEDHPLREDLVAHYLLALYRSGRQADALRFFSEARDRLVEELGIEPGPELRSLHERILAQDTSLLFTPYGADAGPADPTVEHQPRAASGTEEATEAAQRLATVVRTELLDVENLRRATAAEDADRACAESMAVAAAAFDGFGGTVVQHGATEVVATFGVPVSRDDDAYGAIRAALRAHDAIAEHSREIERTWGVGINARSAVDTVPVVVPFDDPDTAEHAYRSVREIAAAAGPDDVLVEERTHRVMGDLFSWDAVPVPVPATGTTAWRVRSVHQGADKARMGRRLHAPMVGRDAEAAVAGEMLESLNTGIGGVLFITGEAGVGKTRFLAELQEAGGIRSLTGHCVAYAEAMPYWPVRSLLRSWLTIGVDDTDLKARVALHRRLDEDVPGDADRLYPYLGGVLGITLEPPQAARLRLASEALQYRTFEAVAELLSGLAGRRPLMVVVEDVHWADPTSLQLIEQLMPLTTEAALLLVLTARPDPDHPSRRLAEQARHRHPHVVREITLVSLGDDAQRTLLDALVGPATQWAQAEYLFKHVLIQEAAYRTLPERPRAELHQRAAEWLEHRHQGSGDEEAALLARHWAAAGLDDKAAPALLRAGDVARRDHALDEAIDHYREVLPLLERRGDRRTMALVLLKLALALHTSLRFAESNDAYQQAFALWQPPPSTEPTAVLRIAGPSPSHVIGADPVRSYLLQDMQLQMALLDRLVERWPDDTIVPSLAERWEISDDGLHYVFHLRDGLVWSDGHPLTAGDVEYGIKREARPATARRRRADLLRARERPGLCPWQVHGSRHRRRTGGRRPHCRVSPRRSRPLLPRHAQPAGRRPSAPARHRAARRRLGQRRTRGGKRAVSSAIGERGRDGPRATAGLPRQPDRQRPNGGVENRASEPPADSIAAYRAGERGLVWIRSVSHDGADMDGLPADEIRFEPATGTVYLAFDHGSPAMSDIRLRRALAHAIDRAALAGLLPPHISVATGGLVPPALAGHTPDITPRFDPDLARHLLSDAFSGWL